MLDVVTPLASEVLCVAVVEKRRSRRVCPAQHIAKHKCVCPLHGGGQTNQNVGVWSREGFTAGPSKENGWFVLKNLKLPDGFGGEVFIGKTWGEGGRVCDFLLTGCW